MPPLSVTRRTFLTTSTLALGAAAIPAQSPSARALTPASFQLGIASYTFRNFDRAHLIQFMAQLHCTAINLKDVKDHLPSDPAGEAAALTSYAAAGIKPHAVGTVSFAKEDEADFRAKFEYARRAGVPVIVAGDPAPASLPLIERLVKQYDIRFAIHNHGPEDKLWPSPLTILRAVEHMDPRLGCCIDIGHTVRAGTDLVEAVRAVGPRLFNIHSKDLSDLSAKESQVAVGEGRLPLREFFRALMDIHYTGFVDLEYEIHPDDPLPGVSSSFSYMRGVLAGLGYSA